MDLMKYAREKLKNVGKTEPTRYCAARREGESYEHYRQRRTKHNILLKRYLRRGFRMFWDSHNQGTYCRNIRKAKRLGNVQ